MRRSPYVPGNLCPLSDWAVVTSTGTVHLNPDRHGTPAARMRSCHELMVGTEPPVGAECQHFKLEPAIEITARYLRERALLTELR